jgi:hypothetical protein
VTDSQCPGGACTGGETCVVTNQQCFVNSGILRIGTAHPTDPIAVAQYCITQTSSGAVNNTAGLPGPGALSSVQTHVRTGIP